MKMFTVCEGIVCQGYCSKLTNDNCPAGNGGFGSDGGKAHLADVNSVPGGHSGGNYWVCEGVSYCDTGGKLVSGGYW